MHGSSAYQFCWQYHDTNWLQKSIIILEYTVGNDCTWMQIIFIDLQRCCFVKLAVQKDYSCFLSLLHWYWVNFMPHNSLTLSRALLPPHSCAVDVLFIPFFKWCWAAWPTVHTLHFCMSISSILFSNNCIQCVCWHRDSGSVEHSLYYHNGYCLLKWFHSYFIYYLTCRRILWFTKDWCHIMQTGN